MTNCTVSRGLPAPKKYQTIHSGNPKRMPGTGKAFISAQEPTEMSAHALLNITKESNPHKMTGTGSFGRVNPKAPDRTPASTYVYKGLVKK